MYQITYLSKTIVKTMEEHLSTEAPPFVGEKKVVKKPLEHGCFYTKTKTANFDPLM